MWTLKCLFAILGVAFGGALIASVAMHFGQPPNVLFFLLAIVSLFGLVGIIIYEAVLRSLERLKHEIIQEIYSHEQRVCMTVNNKFDQANLVKTFINEVIEASGGGPASTEN